jgi:hypothetical protein
MLFRSVRWACAIGLLGASFLAPGCSGKTSSSAGIAEGGSSGGVGGASATGGNAGAAVTTMTCGTKTCNAIAVPGAGTGYQSIPPCCPDGTDNVCGIDTSFLSVVGESFAQTCQALAQPGPDDPSCPESTKTEVEAGAFSFPVQFAGCCRAATGTCGFDVDEIAGGLVTIGLGCVDSQPFLEGGAPKACGAGDAGEAEAAAGAAGSGGS